MSRRLRQEQIRSAINLIGPMGEMIEKMHEVILAHHPAGHDADDCPVCADHQVEMLDILERWADARSLVLEHWDV